MNEILQLDTRCLFEASMSASLLLRFLRLISFMSLVGWSNTPSSRSTKTSYVTSACVNVCVCVCVSKLSIKCEWITGPYNYDRPLLFTFALGKVKASARTSISHHRDDWKKICLSEVRAPKWFGWIYICFLDAAFVFSASMSFDIRSRIPKMEKNIKNSGWRSSFIYHLMDEISVSIFFLNLSIFWKLEQQSKKRTFWWTPRMHLFYHCENTIEYVFGGMSIMNVNSN